MSATRIVEPGEGTVPRRDAASELEQRVARGQPVTLGRYVLLRKLGEGGMAFVFVAFDELLDRRVALKILRPSRRHSAEDRRIHREAQALARLSHPNVVQVYDVVELDDQLFMTMELVQGQTLREWIAERPRPWPQVLEIFRQIGAGLLAAHRHGLVHRDLKPANVLLDDEGRARVADFGLARAEHGMQATMQGGKEPGQGGKEPGGDEAASFEGLLGEPLTLAGQVVGTPAYMAAEQSRGSLVDARSDQFSFCVMLHEALYGRRPFAGNSREELADNVAQGNVLPPTTPAGVPAVPGWLYQAVVRGLSPDPAQRWPDMQSLLDVLARDPEHTRRRWWVGGALTMMGGVVTVAVLARAPVASACRGFEEQLVGVWDEPTRTQAEAAMQGSGLGFAADSWQRVRARLDAYASEWVEERSDVCEGYERAQITLAWHDRQVTCLERRRDHLEALAQALVDGDASVVERATTAASNLPRLDECRDAGALAQSLVPPADAGQADRIEQLRRELTQATVLTELGHHSHGRELAQGVVEQARTVGYGPLLAEALLVTGKIEDHDGKYDAAVGPLDEAVWLARTSGHERVEADAAAEMMMVLGDRLARFDDAEVWRKHALAVLGRRPDDHALEAAIEARMGSVALSRGALADARQHYERSLVIERELGDEDGVRSVAALTNLSSVAKAQGRYDEALELNAKALAIREQQLGPEHPEAAMVVYARGIILENQGDYSGAIASYRRALEQLTRALGPDHMRVAYPRFGLGTVLHFTGHHQEALPELQASLRALEATYGPAHPHVATAYNNIGLVQHALGRHDEALASFTRARDLSTELLGEQHSDVAQAEGNRGMVLIAMGSLEAARQAYERALAIDEAALGREHPDLGYALSGLGEVALGEGRPRDAVPWLERAIAVRKDVPAAERAHSRKLLGQALWEGELDRERALAVAAEAEAIAAACGEDCEDVHAELSTWLRARGKGTSR